MKVMRFTSDSVLKLYVCASGIIVACTGLYEPMSLVYNIIHTSGPYAPLVMIALLAVSIIGIFDTFFNEVVGDVNKLNEYLKKRRTRTLAAVGAVHVMLLFVTASHGNFSWITFRFLIDGIVAATAMIMDVKSTYAHEQIKGRRASDLTLTIGAVKENPNGNAHR